ncbi:MAG: flagellar export chaperone FliS [Verrucomicrobia bacterium]|nr:flagellar export chaperone FliS [Verrucomicrobiota bacterium]
MRPHSHPWQSYRQVATQTASPGQLVLMLYEGAIRFLERALVGFRHDDPLEFNTTINNNILRAQQILGELNSSLNLAAGGEFAENLRRLYNYLDWRLQQSNQRKQDTGIREVMSRLLVLRDAWAQMLEQQTRRSATPREANTLLAQA